jgi:ribosomal-protein-alanine N-acetyltransferase
VRVLRDFAADARFVSITARRKSTSSVPDPLTQRLRLVAITSNLLRCDPAHLAGLLAAEVPQSWPPEHWEPHVFDFLESQYRASPHTIGWNRYVVLRSPTPTLIGTMGGFPKTETEAEVGYSILPFWQRQGLATEGLRAIMDEIFTVPSVTSISAQTFPHLSASVRVLEKSGFARAGDGDEEGTVRYRLQRAS